MTGVQTCALPISYCEVKNGLRDLESIHPSIDHILAETQGIIVYQEQVMQIAQVMAGYSLGGADLLRRAMGKKIAEEMAKERPKFIEGAAKTHGVATAEAGEVFDMLEKFANYGFNKSHAAAYAIVAYQTAYLKANYPVEFLSAMMTNDMGTTEKLTIVLSEAKAMGVEVLPPDVNEGEAYFWPAQAARGGGPGPLGAAADPEAGTTTRRMAIRFGLAAIKGVGEIAVQSIIKAREEGGRFTTLAEMCERCDTRTVNRKVLEALIKCGACDSFGGTRASLFASVERTLTRAAGVVQDRQRGQSSLFGAFEESAPKQVETTGQLSEWQIGRAHV